MSSKTLDVDDDDDSFYGLSTDQTKYFISQIVALLFGLVFRKYIKACEENALKRHVIATSVGFLLGYYCFQNDFFHLILMSTVSYVLLNIISRHYSHLVVFAFVLGYLSWFQLHNQIFYYGMKRFDVTAPLMIVVQKISYIAFSFNDGIRPADSLTSSQKTHVLIQLPTLIEFLSYIFNFQGVTIGPGATYRDYIEFIDGTNIRKYKQYNADSNGENLKVSIEPSVRKVLLSKLIWVILLLAIFLNVTIKYPLETNMSDEILAKSIWYRLGYLYISGNSQRVYYYLAWTLSDLVNNASGFGFNGYDEFGNPKWELLTNISIYEMEISTSIKHTIDFWHMQTSNWLRRIAYERLPSGKTLGVFLLSAIWHGFYPGYYITFITSAMLVYIGRGIRRTIRPMFLKNTTTRILYSMIGWFCTQFSVNYVMVPFFFLGLKRSIEFYNSWWWIVHVAIAFFAIILPRDSFKSKPINKKTA